MEGSRRNGSPFERLKLVLGALVVFALVTSCESKESHALKTHQAALAQPLSALAEQGDVEAMRVIADIEVLRAQSMFSDSAANALTAMPGSAFIVLDPKGQASRFERGQDLTELLAFTSEEQLLLKQGDMSADDAAEVRRLATDNMAAAAEKAKQLRLHHVTGMP